MDITFCDLAHLLLQDCKRQLENFLPESLFEKKMEKEKNQFLSNLAFVRVPYSPWKCTKLLHSVWKLCFIYKKILSWTFVGAHSKWKIACSAVVKQRAESMFRTLNLTHTLIIMDEERKNHFLWLHKVSKLYEPVRVQCALLWEATGKYNEQSA